MGGGRLPFSVRSKVTGAGHCSSEHICSWTDSCSEAVGQRSWALFSAGMFAKRPTERKNQVDHSEMFHRRREDPQPIGETVKKEITQLHHRRTCPHPLAHSGMRSVAAPHFSTEHRMMRWSSLLRVRSTAGSRGQCSCAARQPDSSTVAKNPYQFDQ